ncbi:hypothetical protein [Nocardiopsis changdeensis]|uniref:hypothetical protein n=1 Tax=Nocardiopsis changdeensis TaxID=2831969 RepID=UPI003F46C2CE
MYAWAEEEPARGADFMGARGIVHFDNLLADGRSVYFADFGLALSSGFELPREQAGSPFGGVGPGARPGAVAAAGGNAPKSPRLGGAPPTPA